MSQRSRRPCVPVQKIRRWKAAKVSAEKCATDGTVRLEVVFDGSANRRRRGSRPGFWRRGPSLTRGWSSPTNQNTASAWAPISHELFSSCFSHFELLDLRPSLLPNLPPHNTHRSCCQLSSTCPSALLTLRGQNGKWCLTPARPRPPRTSAGSRCADQAPGAQLSKARGPAQRNCRVLDSWRWLPSHRDRCPARAN